MKKKIVAVSLMVVIAVIAVLAFSVGSKDIAEYPWAPILGGGDKFVISTALPESPGTLSYYKVIDEEYEEVIDPKLGAFQKSLPSEGEAVKIAEEYLRSYGGKPDDAVLTLTKTNYAEKINSTIGKVVEKKPSNVQVIYEREIEGMPVAGPGDTIDFAIGENGKILYLLWRWREIERAGEVEIINATEAVKKLNRGEFAGPPPMTDPERIEIEKIELGYYSPHDKPEFYKPIWIFRDREGFPYPVWAGAK
jgi:hypothetical protein